MNFRRFLVHGVVWRQLLRWAVLNLPEWLEPAVIAWWSLFFLLWGPGRRGVLHNLKAIKPGSFALTNFFRCYRVFWNFAWTITDNVRYKETKMAPDWSFIGYGHFEKMLAGGGAVLLTAHMGSYDLGALIFSETSERHIVMVRAPEVDPQTRNFEESHSAASVQIEFNTQPSELAFALLDRVRSGDIVAIQGDRVTPGISELPVTLFGKAARVPAGPFALAMAARAPIYPVFVLRRGYRSYAVVASEPIEVHRTSNRDEAFATATTAWTRQLEDVIGTFWFQWFAFERFDMEQPA